VFTICRAIASKFRIFFLRRKHVVLNVQDVDHRVPLGGYMELFVDNAFRFHIVRSSKPTCLGGLASTIGVVLGRTDRLVFDVAATLSGHCLAIQ